jgi:hypothetical protein
MQMTGMVMENRKTVAGSGLGLILGIVNLVVCLVHNSVNAGIVKVGCLSSLLCSVLLLSLSLVNVYVTVDVIRTEQTTVRQLTVDRL